MFQTKSRNIQKQPEILANNMISESSIGKNPAIFSFKEPANVKSRNIDKPIVDKSSSKTQTTREKEKEANQNNHKTVANPTPTHTTTTVRKASGGNHKITSTINKEVVSGTVSGAMKETLKDKGFGKESQSKFNKPSIRILSEKSKNLYN